MKVFNRARLYPQNQKTGAVLREVVDQLGDPERAKVMGVPEFHPFVEPAAYRTFHSLFVTRDMRQTLRLIRPDIVVLDRRGINVIGSALRTWRDDIVLDWVTEVLRDEGYRLYETEPLTWNGQWVAIFHRSP